MSYTAAVLTISDKGARGQREDTSGPALCGILRENGWEVTRTAILPDELEQIKEALIRCADEERVDLVLTTGGTGFSSRDVTPEATLAVVERETRGLPEAMRAESMRITPRGCLSRAAAGIRGGTLIVNLPGSEKAARENLLAVLEPVRHGVDMLRSGGSADCAAPAGRPAPPSMDQWLREAQAGPDAGRIGMSLTHTGVVRGCAPGSRPPRCGGCALPATEQGWRPPWPRHGGWRAFFMCGRGSTRGCWRLARTSCMYWWAETSGPTWWRRCSFWWGS